MYSVGGKIVSVGNRFPEFRINTLTFEVTGDRFPSPSNSNLYGFSITFSSPMSYKINYGDGVVESFTNQSSYSIRANQNPGDVHEYIDGNTPNRFVTFEFQVEVVGLDAVSETREIIELIVFRDAQATDMTRTELDIAYPDRNRGFHVVCNQIAKTYILDDINTSPRGWHYLTHGTVSES